MRVELDSVPDQCGELVEYDCISADAAHCKVAFVPPDEDDADRKPGGNR